MCLSAAGLAPISSQPWRSPMSGAMRRDDRPELAPQPIASRGRADRAADREGDAQRDRRGIVEKGAPQGLGSGRATGACQGLERPASADPPDQAESRVRPLSRLALMIARPARVRMRARKPCLRARRRVLGWNVRFTDSRPSRTCSTNGQAPRPVDQRRAAQASGRRRSLNAPRLGPRRNRSTTARPTVVCYLRVTARSGREFDRSSGCYDRCFCTDDLIIDFDRRRALGVVAGVVDGPSTTCA